MKSEGYLLYDVIAKKDIFIAPGEVVKQSKLLSIDSTALPKLGKAISSIGNRFILQSDKEKTFTLVNIDTNQEYECITNKSIFVHLNLPYSDNCAKYVYELRMGRQKSASVAGFPLKLKETELSHRRQLKAKSTLVQGAIDEKRKQQDIKKRLYCRMSHALNRYGAKKADSKNALIGCSSADLREYIESKFSKNMTWDNKGLWHIDHIIPCSEFDLTIVDGQRRCFNYTNLQPIWKSSKIAAEMGEPDFYQGNINKGNRSSKYDYFLERSIRHFFPNGGSVEFAEAIHKKGIRKVIIRAADLGE